MRVGCTELEGNDNSKMKARRPRIKEQAMMCMRNIAMAPLGIFLVERMSDTSILVTSVAAFVLERTIVECLS